MIHDLNLVPILVLSPLLVAVAYFDLRFLRIPNRLVMIALAVFVLTAPMVAAPELGTRILAAVLVFGMTSTAFFLRYLGGGDVKMMTALMLFVPTSGLTVFAYVFSVSMMLAVLITVTIQSPMVAHRMRWVSTSNKGALPAGLCIAMSGISLPYVLLLMG